MESCFFVTGTDTDSGKTLISSALLHLANQQYTNNEHQARTLGLKPIASGCEATSEGLRNADALSLMSQSSIKLPYSKINPIAFKPAIAPHIAAQTQQRALSPNAILNAIEFSKLPNYDFCLIEGAGGWRLPIGNNAFMSQVVSALKLPVIMVVGVKLGALNHAVLTQESILHDGLKIAGWIANVLDPNMSFLNENLQSLKDMMQSPLLGVVPFLQHPSAKAAAQYLCLPFDA